MVFPTAIYLVFGKSIRMLDGVFVARRNEISGIDDHIVSQMLLHVLGLISFAFGNFHHHVGRNLQVECAVGQLEGARVVVFEDFFAELVAFLPHEKRGL